MSDNSFGKLFRFTSWGESHGEAIGCVIDGVPPQVPLSEKDIQPYLDKRKPGQSKFTTQRKEPDTVKILSGVFEGKTTGTPISLIIENQDFVNAFMSSVCNQDIGELFVRHLQNPSSTLEDVIDEPIRAEELCVDQINLEDVSRMVLRTIEKVEQSRNKFSK